MPNKTKGAEKREKIRQSLFPSEEPRGARTWQERMRLLEERGFIKVKPAGNRTYGYVLLVHPANIIEKLNAQGKLPANWIDQYTIRQIETKERTLAERKQAREAAAKVVHIKNSQAAKKKATPR